MDGLLLKSDNFQVLNKLFVHKWGETTTKGLNVEGRVPAPSVSISLKEQKYQPGRAKSYLSQFGVISHFCCSGKGVMYRGIDDKL